MIRKGIIAALAGAILLAVGAARADEVVPDKWLMNCDVDAMTDKRSCNLLYLTVNPGSVPAAWASVGSG